MAAVDGRKQLMTVIILIGEYAKEVLPQLAQDLRQIIRPTLPVDFISISRLPPVLPIKTLSLLARCIERWVRQLVVLCQNDVQFMMVWGNICAGAVNIIVITATIIAIIRPHLYYHRHHHQHHHHTYIITTTIITDLWSIVFTIITYPVATIIPPYYVYPTLSSYLTRHDYIFSPTLNVLYNCGIICTDQRLDLSESIWTLLVKPFNTGSNMATKAINGRKRSSALVNRTIHLESSLKVSCREN